jgi:hypothetical protein
MKKTRLEKELYRMLTPLGIHYASGIFRDWLIKTLGLTEDTYGQMNDFGIQAEGTRYVLNPHLVKATELFKLLNVLKIDLSEYRVGQMMPVNHRWLFETILPKFKAFLDEMVQKDHLFYRLSSRESLENSIIEELERITDKLLNELKEETYDQQGEFVQYLTQLKHQLKSWSIHNPDAPIRLEKTANAFAAYLKKLNSIEMMNDVIYNQIYYLLKSLQCFSKYECSEVRQKCKDLLKREDDSRNNSGASVFSQQFGEYCLSEAGIQITPVKVYLRKTIASSTRVSFSFQGITQKDAENLGDYFKEAGDPSMIAAVNSFSFVIPEDGDVEQVDCESELNNEYWFDLDAEFVHDTLLVRFDKSREHSEEPTVKHDEKMRLADSQSTFFNQLPPQIFQAEEVTLSLK